MLKRILSYLTGAGGIQRTSGFQTGLPTYYSTPASNVTPDSAMQISAVWACVRLLSESISSLPLNIYRVRPDGSQEIAKDHRLHTLFSGKVNRHQTKQEFFETEIMQLALHGNSYSLIQRNGRSDISSLVPLMAQQMEVEFKDDGSLEYIYTESGRRTRFSENQIWHNKLFGNGVIGLSPLGYARNNFALAQAAELAVTNIYANGAKPSGTLSTERALTEVQRAALRENFLGLTEGNDRLLLLEQNLKFEPISMSPQDIELLASRRFQIEDIARVFGVPSVLINDTSSTTAWGSGVQQIVQGFYKLGLRPYLSRLESSIKNRLMTPMERSEYNVEFDFSALIRPDFAERLKVYKEAVTGGIMAPNEARKFENLPPMAGGDSLLAQQQMWPLERLTNPNRQESGGMKKNDPQPDEEESDE